MLTKNRIRPTRPTGTSKKAMGENANANDGNAVPIRLKNEKTEVRIINREPMPPRLLFDSSDIEVAPKSV